MNKETIIYDLEDDIFPDYDDELEKNLFKLSDRYGIELTFLFNNGLSITYDADRYIIEVGKYDSVVTFRDSKTGNILYYLKNYYDRLSLVLGNNDFELVRLNIFNVL